MLETFKPSYALSKVKDENDAIRNRISDFDSTKNPINKLAMNNRRLLIAAEFHFVHSVEKDSQKHRKFTQNSVSLSKVNKFQDAAKIFCVNSPVKF